MAEESRALPRPEGRPTPRLESRGGHRRVASLCTPTARPAGGRSAATSVHATGHSGRPRDLSGTPAGEHHSIQRVVPLAVRHARTRRSASRLSSTSQHLARPPPPCFPPMGPIGDCPSCRGSHGATRIHSSAVDFIAWGTTRKPWRDYCAITGDASAATPFLDCLNII